MAFVWQQRVGVWLQEVKYSFLRVFEDLSRLLPAAALLFALPLHVALFNLLEKGVGSSPPGKHLSGRPAVQKDWWEKRHLWSDDKKKC